jgi:hypothetical protein
MRTRSFGRTISPTSTATCCLRPVLPGEIAHGAARTVTSGSYLKSGSPVRTKERRQGRFGEKFLQGEQMFSHHSRRAAYAQARRRTQRGQCEFTKKARTVRCTNPTRSRHCGFNELRRVSQRAGEVRPTSSSHHRGAAPKLQPRPRRHPPSRRARSAAGASLFFEALAQ